MYGAPSQGKHAPQARQVGHLTFSEQQEATVRSRRLAETTTAAVVILAGAALLFGSAAYYRYPAFAARYLAQITGKPGFLPAPTTAVERVDRSNWPQSASKIPAALQQPLTARSEMMRIDELRQRPALVLDGATLVFDSEKPARIATSKLTLRDSALLTRGADLDIEVETLVIENGEIRAFPPSEKPPAQGAGRDAGKLRLRVHGKITGVLRVDLGGQPGAPGTAGKPGAMGQPGAKGENAVSAPERCVKPAASGAPGGAGAKGGDGGDGASGGAGGQFTLFAKDASEAAGHVEFAANGGRGGAAGPAGPGGEGGPGGPGGAPAGLCIGDGQPGPRGPTGPAGQPGKAGADGAAGAMRTLGLDEKS